MKNRKAIIAGSAIVFIGVGGYLLWQWWKGKQKPNQDGNILPKPPIAPSAVYGGVSSGGSQPITSSQPTTSTQQTTYDVPFKNQAEGDAFRRYVNDNHTDWAVANKLDRSGLYNNWYISKAWKEFGSEYATKLIVPGVWFMKGKGWAV